VPADARGGNRREECDVTQNDPAVPAGAPPEGSPSTGDARVDEALAKLAGLDGLPLPEHPAVFETIHGALTGALGALDTGAELPPAGPGAGPGPAVPGPAAPDR
jgi:hypothetical protein